MTDKELLELAAKAAGINGIYKKEHQAYGDQWVDGIDSGLRFWWNPLADDGDALRLAVKLKIDVMFSHHIHPMHLHEQVTAFAADEKRCDEFMVDPEAATRRAIVRAAAEIGKNM